MLYLMPDTFLKVALNTNKTTPCYDILLKEALNTNKTGHNVIDFNGHIAESGIKHQ